MGSIDNSFMKYRRMKRFRKIFCFMLGFGSVMAFAAFYVYEWNRMPETIYIEAGKEQVIDFNVPASGTLYRESVEAGMYMEPAVESLSRGNASDQSLEIDFSKAIVMNAAEDEVYCADLKLFGVLPYKTVRIESMDTYEVIPSGQTIGIYVKMDGVYVIDVSDFQSYTGKSVMPCEDKLQSGDYIIAVNGKEISRKKDFTEFIQMSAGNALNMKIVRDDEELEVVITPEQALDGQYKIGAWIRDSLQGVGTMTFIEEDGDYAALGHAVRDADTNEVVSISTGALYETSIVSVSKGKEGEPGEVTGLIQYENDKKIGDVLGNTLSGIYGEISNTSWLESSMEEPMPIALKQEIKMGEAYIISSITGECEKYSVEIVDINYNNTENKRALTIKVTDEILLEMTGGIVQGMSGSPILQDGKLIGAVTHVLVNDPTVGYGIFIENMLDAAA